MKAIQRRNPLVIQRFLLVLLVALLFVCGPEKSLEAQQGSTNQQNGLQTDSGYLSDLKEDLKKEWPGNRTINIVFHGHSVPSGYARTPLVNTFDSYPYLFLAKLKAAYPYAVVNIIVTAKGGENSESGAARFESDVLIHRPDVLLIDYALNDFGLGLERARKAWSTMIEMAKKQHIKTLLVTPSPDLRVDLKDDNNDLRRHSDQIIGLAKENGIGVVNSFGVFDALYKKGDSIKNYMAQVNHPNRAGNGLIADEIMKWFYTAKLQTPDGTGQVADIKTPHPDFSGPSARLTDIGSYPLLKKGITYTMQSSYDRSGGNDDGFNGTYSVIGKQNGNAIISQLDGPGMITRIWFPADRDYPDVPMGLRNKRIFIYLDGNEQPVIDMPIVEMFNNTNPHFPYPLCGMSLGGCWCYVPMPFRKGARIVVEGDKANFFHVQYNRYPDAGEIKTFTLAGSPWTLDAGKAMDPLWNPGDIGDLIGRDTMSLRSSYVCHPGSNTIRFPEGPSVLRAFMVRGSQDELEKMLEGRLQIFWDDEKTAAIDVPLSMFFARESSGLNDKNLMAGTLPGGAGIYNFFPMPYRRHAHVELFVPRLCKLEITAIFQKPAVFDRNLCYLHIHHAKDYPTTPGKRFVWLDVQGEGHYAGIYMRASGKSLGGAANTGTVYWTGCLEGDEVFEMNGEMIEHGTGTEDYFNAGWNGLHGKLDHAQVFPFHGFTLFEAAKDSSRVAAFRWHLPTEVVPFNGHFKASIEVGPQDDWQGNYESIAYYYLTRP